MSNATTKTITTPSAGALRAADQILEFVAEFVAEYGNPGADELAFIIDHATGCADLLAALEASDAAGTFAAMKAAIGLTRAALKKARS